MATPTPGGPQTNLGLEPNIAAVICYVPCCVGLVFSVVAAIVEKQSPASCASTRFRAFSSRAPPSWCSSASRDRIRARLDRPLGSLGLIGPCRCSSSAAFGVLGFLMIKANAGEESSCRDRADRQAVG